MKIPLAFYQRQDVTLIAKELLGKYLLTNFNGILTGGKIVETEAYAGTTDKACHAYGGRRTPRTEVMYDEGGVVYVYLCYGIHHLFNIITHDKDVPHAVLIRAIEPEIGIDAMLVRRNKPDLKYNLTSGPGAMSEALGIKTKHTQTLITGDQIWLEDRNVIVREDDIISGTRVGVKYAEEDALLPYRYSMRGNSWVSRAK